MCKRSNNPFINNVWNCKDTKQLNYEYKFHDIKFNKTLDCSDSKVWQRAAKRCNLVQNEAILCENIKLTGYRVLPNLNWQCSQLSSIGTAFLEFELLPNERVPENSCHIVRIFDWVSHLVSEALYKQKYRHAWKLNL